MAIIGESVARAIIHAPMEKINLGDWMFSLTSEEYAACASGHQSAAQGVLPSGKRISINLEYVAGFYMVQHYIENVAERDHVIGVSSNTIFWVDDVNFVLTKITWELKVEKIDANTTELICRVLTESDNEEFVNKLHEAVKNIPLDQTPAQLHINEETPLFAKDIERKALAGKWSDS